MIKRILEIISVYVDMPANSYDENTNFIDLGIDSLRMIKIIIDIEEAFGVSFEDSEIVDIKNALDIENFISQKLQ
ncbi:MAG: acyl carrier protein [Clostridia bacterium]|nr:acyl carrier protein [Clostridia bacterium]